MSTRPDQARMGDGFRHRGDQVTRLEAFVDAAFAFALTLLVISIDAIPESIDALLLALRGVPSFALGFAVIALFWALHARWSRRFGLDDRFSTVLSLLLVFLVMVFVYPLKLLSGLLFAWVSGGWLPAPAAIGGVHDLRVVYVVYGIGFALLSLCVAELHAHALRLRASLRLDAMEAAATAADVASWRFAVLVALLSVGAALLLPSDARAWQVSLPGFVYFLMNLAWPIARITQRRWLQRAAAP